MLELGPRELLTLGTVLAGLAATWGVLKATIKSIVGQLNDIKSDVTKIYQQVDNQEANQAVLQNSIKIISQDILSPQILKEDPTMYFILKLMNTLATTHAYRPMYDMRRNIGMVRPNIKEVSSTSITALISTFQMILIG